MDYGEVQALADRVSDAAAAMESGQSTLDGSAATSRSIPVPSMPHWSAFGNTPSASACGLEYYGAKTSAVTAAGRLSAILAADSTRLEQVISIFRQTDHESADEICRTGSNSLAVYTTHVHSKGSGERGPDDQTRARQLNDAVGTLGANPGPTIFTGDLNEKIRSNTESAGVLNSLVTDMGFENAGDAAGPTSNNGEGRQIDYIFTSPELDPDSENADNVAGDPAGNHDLSDHNGIAVTVEVPTAWR